MTSGYNRKCREDTLNLAITISDKTQLKDEEKFTTIFLIADDELSRIIVDENIESWKSLKNLKNNSKYDTSEIVRIRASQRIPGKK